MWVLIFGSIFLGAVLGMVYLSGRFAKFSVVQKVAKGRKGMRFLLGFFLVLLILLATGLALGAINAMIIILHLMGIWLICDGVCKLVEKKRDKKFEVYYAGVFALGLTVAYLLWGWYLAHNVWRQAYILETEKQVGAFRIVQFADSHVGSTFDGEGFAEKMQMIQSENPDIVVVTGDYVDDDTTKEDMIAACKALGRIKTTYGVYYVLGNHDKGYYNPEYRGYDGDDLIAELEKNNVTVLRDETVLIDNRFYIIGRLDRSEEQRGAGRASMEELISGLDPKKYSIVLDHQPYEYEEQALAGVDLVLSGHTHGGQMFPINHLGELTGVDAKTYGLENRGDTNFIVTSGISDWAIKFKTGCRSEYVVVDIKEK